MIFPPFTGFPLGAQSFLRGLAANNERAWFTEHKADYERDVLAPMKSLIAELVAELQRKKLPFTGDPARAIFRIHRDVRFARDKAPYKTHAGAVLTRTGQKWNPGLLYVHVDPAGSFCAAGFYQPEPEPLSCLREAIATEPKTFLAMEKKLHAKGLELSRDESMVRLPRGFEHAADNPAAWAIRLRNFTVRRALPAAALRKPALVQDIVAFAVDARPLLEFGWKAIAV
jgi:uncharacterized protein (TIGR02453 family)